MIPAPSNPLTRLDLVFFVFYGFAVLVSFSLYLVKDYFVFFRFADYLIGITLFFIAFFLAKLIFIFFAFFAKNNHSSLLFVNSLSRLSLFLLAFVIIRNTVAVQIQNDLVLIAISVFFLFSLLEGGLKMKFVSRN